MEGERGKMHTGGKARGTTSAAGKSVTFLIAMTHESKSVKRVNTEQITTTNGLQTCL